MLVASSRAKDDVLDQLVESLLGNSLVLVPIKKEKESNSVSRSTTTMKYSLMDLLLSMQSVMGDSMLIKVYEWVKG